MSAVRIGIDQGTTGTRVVAFDESWTAITDAYRPVPSQHPHPGWVEKDAEAVIASVQEAVAEVVASVGAEAITSAGLDNEGETVVAWDAESLRPLAPAVVWSCRRSEGIVERLRAEGVEERVRALAGTPLEPYFSSTKITWLLENSRAVQAAAAAGRARFGTLDAYVLARLGDGARTEPSTAARTQLQAIAAPGRWDPELCRIFGVDPATLPPIGPSTGALGSVAGLPLRGMLVDQTAALAGHGCIARRRRQGHLRHRRVSARKRRRARAGRAGGAAAHGGVDDRRRHRLRAGRRGVLGRIGDRLAARRAAADRDRRGDRGAGALGARHRRGALPARADRARRAVVAIARTRHLGRHDRAHDPRAPGAGGAGVDHAARARHRRGPGEAGIRPADAAGRRRHDPKRLDDAAPGGHARHPGARLAHRGGDGAGRGGLRGPSGTARSPWPTSAELADQGATVAPSAASAAWREREYAAWLEFVGSHR